MTAPSKFYLFRRSNGIYYIGYWHEGRKLWKTTGCRNKADALKAVTGFHDLFKAKPFLKRLSLFREEFLVHAGATFSPATVELHSRALRHLLAIAGDVALPSLNPQHLDRFKVERLNSGLSPVSVNMELRALKAALNTAVRWQLLECNPFQELQQVKVPDLPPAFLSKPDFQKLLSVIKENWLREIVIFAVSTGMRQGEMLNLRWSDVDLSRRLIHIQSSGTFKTKQGKRRTIPLSDAISSMLQGKASGGKGELVFSRRGFLINADFVQHKFKYYIRDAKLNEALHWHSLRHTHASWLVQDGVSLYEVQRLLGHSTSKVTEVYSHLQPEHLHKTVNRIDAPLN